MRALGLLLVLVGCSSSPPNPDASIEDAASEASNDAPTETSTSSGDGGCTPGMGGGGGSSNGGSTCYETFKCAAGTYRVDCACPAASCTCSAPEGGVYKSVPFDCTNGCGFPLSTAAVTACGL